MSASSSPEPVVTINGTAYPYEPGDTVIRVAHRHGIDVPHYCYHPSMSPAGNCRICMVEVVGSPRPQIACKMACFPGLSVNTDSDLAHEARADTMQMLLVNHPLDCPICDQAGECHLQDYSYQLGSGRAVTSTPKTKLPKNQPFGEQIVYDAERCIKCTLCVRFCEEITDTNELSMGQRSDHEQVIMTSAGEFTTRYSMNIVDLCLVGALTSRDFRFRSRLWFMDFVPSVCTGCARGCNVTVGARMGKVLRLEPRENQDVNQWWMCDAGRLGYKHANSATRLGVPAVRDASGAWREATFEQAIQAASAALAEHRHEERPGHVLLDGGATLEEMWVARQLAAALGGEARFAAHVGDDGDEFLVVNEKGANARGAEALGLARVKNAADAGAAVLVIERDEHVPADLRAASGAVVAFVTDASHVPDSVRVAFPFGSFAERDGWLVNVGGRVQRLLGTGEAGPSAVQPFQAVAQEILLDLDAGHDVLDDAALETRLRAAPGLADLVWPPASREPAEVSS